MTKLSQEHPLASAVGSVIHLLAEWLVDNTESVFEEQPEIDNARSILIDAYEAATGTLP